MATWLAWLDQNWFNLIQTLGILGSIGLTAAALRRETQGRKIGDYLTLATQHRELWSEAHRRPDLARIFHTEVDLVAAPVTVAEEEFLRLVIVHFNTGWLLAKDGVLINLDVLATDARAFLVLPLPRVVWDATRTARDQAFVQFVEDALARRPPTRRRRVHHRR